MNHKARYICVPPSGIWRVALPIMGVLTLLALWRKERK